MLLPALPRRVRCFARGRNRAFGQGRLNRREKAWIARAKRCAQIAAARV
jgi:hypothetical protein